MTAKLIIDQSRFVRENAREVEVAIVFGGAMAIPVVLLFMLDLRSTLISAVALPRASSPRSASCTRSASR
jgi:multidrug efflux pump subunit AcrB